MERNALSFLDLVTQFLAVMIIVIAVSANTGQGVGLIKTGFRYEMLCVTFSGPSGNSGAIAASADANRCSIQLLENDKSTIMLMSAQQRDENGASQKVEVRIQKDWLNKTATIRCWDPENPNPNTPITGTLKADVAPKLLSFVEIP